MKNAVGRSVETHCENDSPVIRDEESRRDEAKHIARLRAVSEKIDRLQTSLPQSIDPRLKHYLERKSYEKALEHLETINAGDGT